jgi:hypothetical protein
MITKSDFLSSDKQKRKELNGLLKRDRGKAKIGPKTPGAASVFVHPLPKFWVKPAYLGIAHPSFNSPRNKQKECMQTREDVIFQLTQATKYYGRNCDPPKCILKRPLKR